MNSRGGNLSSGASNAEIANAIKQLNLATLGNITYTYHYHNSSSSCYVAAQIGEIEYLMNDSNNDAYYCGKCKSCGYKSTFLDGVKTHECSSSYYNCGYSNGAITGATIIY